jgi:hypothetical protein
MEAMHIIQRDLIFLAVTTFTTLHIHLLNRNFVLSNVSEGIHLFFKVLCQVPSSCEIDVRLGKGQSR